MFYIVTLTYQNGTNDCRPRPTKLQSCQVVIRNERDILNVVTSKAPKVASRPAGVLGHGGGGSPQRGTGRSPGEKYCE